MAEVASMMIVVSLLGLLLCMAFGGPVMATFDPAPVLALMEPGRSSREIGLRLGVSGGLVRMWRTGRRGLSSGTADRIAVDLGLHPSILWVTWPEPNWEPCR